MEIPSPQPVLPKIDIEACVDLLLARLKIDSVSAFAKGGAIPGAIKGSTRKVTPN